MSFDDEISVAEIADLLRADAENLARRLYSQGVKNGNEFKIGSIWGEKGQSLSIHIGSGARRGVWSDFASGESGDMLELIQQAECNGDKGAAVKWAKQYLGLEDGTPKQLENAKRRAAQHRKKASEAPRNPNYGKAMHLWGQSQVSIKGTPADLYLKGRGIDLAKLGYQPRSLRFHPAVFHRETKQNHPCLVALVVGNDNKPCAIHRTYLEVFPDGVGKLSGVQDQKLTLGTYKHVGGCIRLWRGASKKSLSELTAPEPVILQEGIEDSLSIVLAVPDVRVWCTVSVANIRNVVLPDMINPVYLGKDNDAAGSEADQAFLEAVRVHQSLGKTVIPFAPPEEFKDFNEMIKGGPS